jgi:Na+-translocating ferredoxin:NAD+ oxidoreductase RnfG subunit
MEIENSACVWSRIGTNFDPDEETANFGTRHAVEASGMIFDVFTHATVTPQVSQNSKVIIMSKLCY